MSHDILHTQAVILGYKNVQESNKLLYLFTKDFGLIYVNAQSLRESHSKLRFHSNLFSLVDVDIVMGKDMWKLTGIQEQISSLSFAEKPLFFEFWNTLSSLVIRLCHGEEASSNIWYDLILLFEIIPHIDSSEMPMLEILVTIRLLYHLGYWDGNEFFLLSSFPFQKRYYQEILHHHKEYVARINAALKETQL